MDAADPVSPTGEERLRSQSEGTSPRTPTSSSGGCGDKSWSQKRKEHVIARAKGLKPTEPEIAVTAISFISKLKLGAAQSTREKPARLSFAEKKETNSLSWKEKRMSAFLATRGERSSHDSLRDSREEPGSLDASFPDEAVGGGELGRSVTDAEGRSPRSSLGSQREKSWTARRKEAYLKKYGFARDTPVEATDVAVSSVAFVTKLRQRAEKRGDGFIAEEAHEIS